MIDTLRLSEDDRAAILKYKAAMVIQDTRARLAEHLCSKAIHDSFQALTQLSFSTHPDIRALSEQAIKTPMGKANRALRFLARRIEIE
jgi:hypothetical protein